ncbi:transcriptional repressor [Amycolatopsis sp. H6(2020)]|nr:transcriptional repressor [Amycolatopsis sp. H6(2020)]
MNTGHRTYYQTRQRQAVLDAVARARGFLSAKAVHARLRARGERISLTTVYRALRVLTETGHIDTTHDDSGAQLFHVATGSAPGHYLRCRCCGLRTPIDAVAAEHWARTAAAGHGYTDIHVFVDFNGICRDCRTP